MKMYHGIPKLKFNSIVEFRLQLERVPNANQISLVLYDRCETKFAFECNEITKFLFIKVESKQKKVSSLVKT